MAICRVRQVYLITYSQADPEKVSSRAAFSEMVREAFSRETSAKLLHWVCSREYHQDGGPHFHMALKLDRCHRWLRVRQHLQDVNGIKVNFSDSHYNYYSAWQYVVKEDGEALMSPGHPDLGAGQSPHTSRASARRHCASKGSEASQPRKKARLSSFDVSEIVVEKGIRTRLGLLALATKQKAEGKTDLAEFIINRGKRVVNDAIEVGTTILKLQAAFNPCHSFQSRRYPR